MKQIPILQLNQKLLTGTAVLGLGSIVAGAIGGPVLSGIANFTAGMVGNNLGALVDKLRNSRDVLRNQDLAKAAGRSLGLALGKVGSDFPEIEKPLKALAEKTEGYWLEYVEGTSNLTLFESLREEQLVKVFANEPQEFARYRVLEIEEWRQVTTWLFEVGCEKGVLLGSVEEDYGDVVDALAKELNENFNKNLREVLKDDAANGGEAFAGMLLDLHWQICTFTGHSDRVNTVAIAPDGKRGLSGSKDSTLKLWDLESVRELRTFTGHSYSVNAVAIAPDGKRALSASTDGTLKLWDLKSVRELRTFIGHIGEVTAVAIAPNGKRGLSGSTDKTLKLWDLESVRELHTFTGHSLPVTAVAIAPDGKRGLSGSKDSTLKLWDLESVRELRTFTSHSSRVWAVAIAPDGKRALSGSGDKILNSSSSDNTLKLWDLECVRELRTFTGHSLPVTAVAIAPDGKRALSGSLDKTLKLWDLESGEVLATFTADAAVKSCAIAPDGLAVVAGDSSGRMYFLRLEGGLSGFSSVS